MAIACPNQLHKKTLVPPDNCLHFESTRTLEDVATKNP